MSLSQTIKVILVFLLLIGLKTSVLAQSYSNALHVGLDAYSYKGDLGRAYHKWSGGIRLGASFNKKKRVNGIINFSYGLLTGQSTERLLENELGKKPNTFFNTSILALNVNVCINIIKKDHYKIYFGQGVGIIRYIPKDEYGALLQDQFNTRADGESFANISFSLPTRLGGTYLFENGFGVNAEIGFMNTVTDYLDNVSQFGTNEGNDNIM